MQKMAEIFSKIKLNYVVYLLFFLIFLTSSFDIFMTVELFSFTFRISQLFCFGLFGICIYKIFKNKNFKWPIGVKSLIIWLILILLFTFNTILPKVNFAYNMWLIFNVFIIFVFINLIEKKDVNRIIKLYIYSFFIISILGIVQFILGVFHINFFIKQWWIPNVLPRVNGFTFEPSYYSTYLLIGWTLCRVLLMNKSIVQKLNIKLIPIILTITAAIILSSSRMGIIMVIGFECINCLINFIIGLKNKNKEKIKKYLKYGLGIIGVFVASVILIFILNADFLLNGIGFGHSNHSISIRNKEFLDVLDVFKETPIIGTGLGGLYVQIAHNRGYDVTMVDVQDKGSGICVFAEVLAASGIIGFIFFISFLLIMFYKGILLYKQSKNDLEKSILLAFMISLFMELFILQFNQNILRIYLWIHLALFSVVILFFDKKRKINVIDARMINMSGIGTYIKNYMKFKCYDYALGNKEELKNYISNDNVIEYNSKIYGIKEQLKFPYLKLFNLNPKFLHVPHYNVPILYSGDLIVTIHDLTHLEYPEFLPNKFAYYYAKFMIWFALHRAKYVLTVSEYTKKDILKHFKVSEDKIIVTYNGVGDEFKIKEKKSFEYLYKKFNIPKNKKILMYVGNLKPHKNLERLLIAFSKLSDKSDKVLLLVGKAFENYNSLEETEEKLGIKQNVIHTGIVTQDELVDLYNLSNLFIFPSLYEGFGLPILESLKCGTPVICSNNSSIPEVGGNLVDYFDACNPDEIKTKIEKNIDIKSQFDYKKVMKHLENFEWEKSTEKVKNIFSK